ncbi:MAG TPA: helix-turn-helix domain-containing protein, partial [Acidimicrobiia bacterium]
MTHEQELMSGVAKTVFRLNGQLFILGEALATRAGLTAAWWQVLGAILRQPLSVADVAREIGVTRQSVQRVADLLVAEGLAEYQPNPAHARSKLLAPTTKGRDAVRRIAPA